MSILIKGADLPRYCKLCLFSWAKSPEVDECQLMNRVVMGSGAGRPDWCPLVGFPLEPGEKIKTVRKTIKSTVSWVIEIVGTWETEEETK